MATYNNYENNNAGSSISNDNVTNRGFFNRMLRGLSNWGMDIEQMIIKNTVSIGIHEDTTNISTNMYDIFTKKIISKILSRKSIAYLDRAYIDKRKILKQYSLKDEIKDFISQIADESIIYDENNFFCKMVDLPDEFDNTVKQRYQENFSKIMKNFGFNDGLTAWNFFKNFLIDGFMAFEIVYDDKQKNIIDLSVIDPITLVVATDPGTGTIVWIQYPDNPQIRRVLLDSQIIYLSYSNNNEYSETSYVEGLIRPYNQLKMLEQTRLLYNINQASIYKIFKIPTQGLTRNQAQEQVRELMSEYHEDVDWDESTGTILINGSPNIPHSKDFWFPEGELGTPSMEIQSAQGTDLNEDTMLNWFYKILKRASKLPFSRFADEGGGGTLFNSESDVTREELKFSNYIRRLRTIFKELVVKPLRIQMILDFPELKNDNLFHQSIRMDYNSNELFEEWKRLSNMNKRAEIVSNLTSNLKDAEDKPYLSIEWLMKNVMKFSDSDLSENNRYKLKSGGAGTGEGAGGGEMGGGGGGGIQTGGEEMGGGGGEIQGGGGEIQGGGIQGGGIQGGGTQGTQPTTQETPPTEF